MLDNIIENENSYLIKQIKTALSYLANESRVDYSKQRVYEKTGRDFAKLTDFIASEKKYVLSKYSDPYTALHELSKRFYRKISSQDEYVLTIVVAAQALFYEHIMKGTGGTLPDGFISGVKRSLYSLDDKHMKTACELFAKLLSYKISLLALIFDTSSSEKIVSVYYPDSIKKEYKHQAVLLTVGTKVNQIKAYGYPLEEFEKKFEGRQGSRNGYQEGKAKEPVYGDSNGVHDSKPTEQTVPLENGLHPKENVSQAMNNDHAEEEVKLREENQDISHHKEELRKEEVPHQNGEISIKQDKISDQQKETSTTNETKAEKQGESASKQTKVLQENKVSKNEEIASKKAEVADHRKDKVAKTEILVNHKEEGKSQKVDADSLKQDENLAKDKEISYEKVNQKEESYQREQVNIPVKEKLEVKAEISTKKEPSQLITCDICGVPVDSLDVFKNNLCRHKYCIYCVQDSEMRIKNYCLLKNCHSRMHSDKFLQFVDEWNKRKEKEDEKFKQSPLQTSSIKDSTQTTNTNNNEKPTEKVVLKECDYCYERRDANKMFLNPCGHKFCTKCLQKKGTVSSQYCPASGCYKLFDYEGMNNYFVDLMTEELVSTRIICKGCKAQNEIKHSKSSKPEYYKCEKCGAAACLKHDNLMSACLCYCEKCLSSMELNIRTMIKFCKKCSKGYCALCGDKKTSDKPCECVCPNCLERKDHMTDTLCSSCLSQARHCSVCMDTLEEVNEQVQKCGHRICLKCMYDIFDAPAKSKPFTCPTCMQIKA